MRLLQFLLPVVQKEYESFWERTVKIYYVTEAVRMFITLYLLFLVAGVWHEQG